MQYESCKSISIESIKDKKVGKIRHKIAQKHCYLKNIMLLKNTKCIFLEPCNFLNTDPTPVKFCFHAFYVWSQQVIVTFVT